MYSERRVLRNYLDLYIILTLKYFDIIYRSKQFLRTRLSEYTRGKMKSSVESVGNCRLGQAYYFLRKLLHILPDKASNVNTYERSYNHCCSGQEISVTYSDSVCSLR